MTQGELIALIARKNGLPKKFTKRIIKFILNTIVLELKKQNPVSLRNFGTFQSRISHGKTRAKFYASENIFKYYGKEK